MEHVAHVEREDGHQDRLANLQVLGVGKAQVGSISGAEGEATKIPEHFQPPPDVIEGRGAHHDCTDCHQLILGNDTLSIYGLLLCTLSNALKAAIKGHFDLQA